MLPRRPERQTDSVYFTLGDTTFTPESSFSFVFGWRGKKKPNQRMVFIVRYVSLGCLTFKYRGIRN